MSIQWTATPNGGHILHFSGSLNFSSRHDLMNALHWHKHHQPQAPMHVDLSRLEHIDSLGLGLLLLLKDRVSRLGQSIILQRCNRDVRWAVVLAGLHKEFALQ